MQLVQRGEVIFATLFVYDQSGNPIWYTATLNPTETTLTWSGDLYVTSGPWFGTVPFNPALVGSSVVGAMSWSAASVNEGEGAFGGTVTYSVNGVVVTKNVVRQTLVLDDYNGTYLGALNGTLTQCSNPAEDNSGTAPATINIVQSGESVTITASGDGVTLTAIGTLTQYGQFGTIREATYSNTIGAVGVITLFEINGQMNYWTSRFSLIDFTAGCHETGTLGGMRE